MIQALQGTLVNLEPPPLLLAVGVHIQFLPLSTPLYRVFMLPVPPRIS